MSKHNKDSKPPTSGAEFLEDERVGMFDWARERENRAMFARHNHLVATLFGIKPALGSGVAGKLAKAVAEYRKYASGNL